MKLIETQVEKKEQRKKLDAEALRLSGLQTAISEETSKLNEIKQESGLALKEFEEKSKKEIEEKMKRKAALEIELVGLEKRREVLMRPLDSLKNELEQRHKQIIFIEQNLANGTMLLDKRSAILGKEVAEYQKAKFEVQYQKEVNARKHSELIDFQGKLNEERKGLINRLGVFEKERQVFLSWLDDERMELARLKAELEAKNRILEMNMADLEKEKTKIKSERAALAAAKKEIYG